MLSLVQDEMQKDLPGEFLDYISVHITCFILLKVWGGLDMSEIWVLGTSVFVDFFFFSIRLVQK